MVPRGLLTAISLILLLFFVLYPLGVLFANSVTGGRRLYAAGLSRAAGGLAVPGGLRQHADPGPGRHRLHRAGVGVPFAYMVARYDFPLKNLVAILPVLTIVIPEIIVGQSGCCCWATTAC